MKWRWLFLFSILISFSAHAQNGTGNGGGTPYQFLNLGKRIQAWLDKRFLDGTLDDALQLTKNHMTPAELLFKYKSAVLSVGMSVKIPDERIYVGEVSAQQMCANHHRPDRIQCDWSMWKFADLSFKIPIVFHEYLGIADIETNNGVYSSFPISMNIAPYLKEIMEMDLKGLSIDADLCAGSLFVMPGAHHDPEVTNAILKDLGKKRYTLVRSNTDASHLVSIEYEDTKVKVEEKVYKGEYVSIVITDLDGNEIFRDNGRTDQSFYGGSRKTAVEEVLKNILSCPKKK